MAVWEHLGGGGEAIESLTVLSDSVITKVFGAVPWIEWLIYYCKLGHRDMCSSPGSRDTLWLIRDIKVSLGTLTGNNY